MNIINLRCYMYARSFLINTNGTFTTWPACWLIHVKTTIMLTLFTGLLSTVIQNILKHRFHRSYINMNGNDKLPSSFEGVVICWFLLFKAVPFVNNNKGLEWNALIIFTLVSVLTNKWISCQNNRHVWKSTLFGWLELLSDFVVNQFEKLLDSAKKHKKENFYWNF